MDMDGHPTEKLGGSHQAFEHVHNLYVQIFLHLSKGGKLSSQTGQGYIVQEFTKGHIAHIDMAPCTQQGKSPAMLA